MDYIEDNIDLPQRILDFSIDNEERIKLFEKYILTYNENDSLELLTRITGMYQFSGIKILETFLFGLTAHSFISIVLKLEAAKSLLLYSDKEEKIKKTDNEDEITIKKENNIQIRKKNLERQTLAYESLDLVLYQEMKINQLSTPCKIEAIFMLMQNTNYTDSSNTYFKNVINDEKIDCDYRYKTILSLEIKNIPDYKFYIVKACKDFIRNDKNDIRYRNLASQYLLQHNCLKDEDEKKIYLTTELKIEIQNTILSFCNNEDLEYNTRADCADTLLRSGDDKYKLLAKEIIKKLGRIEGGPDTIFNNAQNVHQDEIEKSVYEILEFLLTYQTAKTGESLIDLDFVCRKIKKLIEVPFCDKCSIINVELSKSTLESIIDSVKNFISLGFKEKDKFCSEDCKRIFERNDNINISLNRIYMDRTLYSKYNVTLSGVLVKIWSYILNHEYKDELTTRIIQELEDSSGTCTSGYLSRLVNVLSGYDDKFGIRISWEDQIVANFSGRLNARIRKITEPDSPFYKEKINDVIEIYLNSNESLKKSIINTIINSKPSNAFYKESFYSTQKIDIKEVINEYLCRDRYDKIRECVEIFAENVLNEITLETHKFSERPNFLLFFRTYMSSIRQELFEEFKEYINSCDFDLYFRKAISSYEGCESFV